MKPNLIFDDRKECGDATCWYTVKLTEELTIKEFIEQIRQESAEEHNHGWFGDFTISNKDEYTWPFMEYRSGKLYASRFQDKSPWKETLDTYGDMKITSMRANGGWGNMSYYIRVD